MAKDHGSQQAGDAEGLSRERVVEAAIDLLARQGVQGLSMRGLADELGVAPMTLYWHVENKDDLLEAVVQQVLSDLDVAVPEDAPWDDRLFALLSSVRRQLLAHPSAVTLLGTGRRLSPVMLRLASAVVTILRDAGFSDVRSAEACRVLLWQTVAHVYLECGLAEHVMAQDSRSASPDDIVAFIDTGFGRAAELEADDDLREIVPMIVGVSPDDLYTQSIEAAFDGLLGQPHRRGGD